MSTLLEAQTELQARGFSRIPAARLTLFLNVAKNQFEDAYPFPWLESTTSGPAPLTIADLKQVLYVVDATNQVELLGVPAQQVIAELDPVITTTGAGRVWWLDGAGVIKTWPASTSAQLSVRYLKESPELAAAGDTPLIPARYHQTWIDLAAIRAHLDRANTDQAASLRQLVAADLAQIISRYDTRNRQNAQFQTVRGYSEDW